MAENTQHSSDLLNDDPSLDAARKRGHEGEGLHVRAIVWTAVSLFVLAVVSLGIVALMLQFHSDPGTSPVAAAEEWPRQTSAPGVTPDQTAVREAFDRQLRRELVSYQWQDADHEVARIPIERAMELLAERKLKVSFTPSSDQTQEAKP